MTNERDIRDALVADGAKAMMVAARTAPKAKGVDLIEIVLIDRRDELEQLSAAMHSKAEECGMGFLHRDAENILSGSALLLLGTRAQTLSLNCGYCGYPHCSAKPEANPCAFNSIDLGIAVGSACATAADRRLDTRVMFSAGWVAKGMGLMPGCTEVLAIAISATAKNPFFDRK